MIAAMLIQPPQLLSRDKNHSKNQRTATKDYHSKREGPTIQTLVRISEPLDNTIQPTEARPKMRFYHLYATFGIFLAARVSAQANLPTCAVSQAAQTYLFLR